MSDPFGIQFSAGELTFNLYLSVFPPAILHNYTISKNETVNNEFFT